MTNIRLDGRLWPYDVDRSIRPKLNVDPEARVKLSDALQQRLAVGLIAQEIGRLLHPVPVFQGDQDRRLAAAPADHDRHMIVRRPIHDLFEVLARVGIGDDVDGGVGHSQSITRYLYSFNANEAMREAFIGAGSRYLATR
jgi:hypothetical protein